MIGTLPSLDNLKAQAKRLRTTLSDDGNAVSHSKSLELVAHQYGFRDWNTMHAAVGNRPAPGPVALGERVRGSYLGQAFAGEVVGVQALSPGRYRVTFDFDEPVDVVTFESFSAFRKRVSCTVDDRGRTFERTSNGAPQLELQRT